MKPRDCFGVVVRSVGLLMLLADASYFYSAAADAMIFHGEPRRSLPGIYIGAGAIVLFLSIYFLRGAPHLVRFAYPATQEIRDDTNAA